MLQTLNRYMPAILSVMVLIMLVSFIENHWPGVALLTSVVSILRAGAWYIAAAAVLGWVLLILTWLHWRSRLPAILQTRTLMDILDRLSNKQTIEQGITEQETATFVDAVSLSNALKQLVIGQDTVCDDVAMQIRRRLALSRRGKPVGIFLFAGPPGTGKTYLAKVLAKELERPLLHFDMAQFSSGSHALSQLLGISLPIH